MEKNIRRSHARQWHFYTVPRGLIPRKSLLLLLTVVIVLGCCYSMLLLLCAVDRNDSVYLNPLELLGKGADPCKEGLSVGISEKAAALLDSVVVMKKPQSDVGSSTSFKDYVEEYPQGDLRSKLAAKFPYDRATTIPSRIFQTWKSSFDEETDPQVKRYLQSWMEQEGYEYHLVTDEDLEDTVMQLYGDFPEIIDTFHKLPKDILRFDFLRYLLLFAKGGIYSDVDAVVLKSLDNWADNPDVLAQYMDITQIPSSHNIGFLVGIEGDYDRADWRYKTCRRLQFCQWTFKSKKGHPILRELINSIVELTMRHYNERLNHVKIGREYFTLHSLYTVLEWTGPGIFTDSIFNHLNKIYNDELAEAEFHPLFINENESPSIEFTEFESYHKEKNSINLRDGKHLGWSNFTKISKPILYDDVLILPLNSFNGFVTDLQYFIDNDLTYIQHDFHGSWKNL